ncbi:MAG: large-conductance mechanosensitive channel protein MscL [Planctomycetota bacterium]|nr:large-conductance mechanosensitive channel protein MscL [Planctomycetota bacterium]
MGFLQEFREFAVKGNAVDMAVGIILGASFNRVVNSVVNDIIMPPIGLLIGGVEFKDLAITLKEARVDEAGAEIAAVSIRYGMFINTVVDFLITALVVFMIVKFMNRLIRKREQAAA